MSRGSSSPRKKVVARREIFRISSPDSQSPPFTIEERQYYSASAGEPVLKSLGGTFIILRRGSAYADGEGDVCSIGPAMHSILGMKLEESEEDGSGWESAYATALYCMEHPDVIKGNGLKVGG